VYGGGAEPIQAIAEILCTKNASGHIQIADFATGSALRRRPKWMLLTRLPFNLADYREKEIGVSSLWVEPEFTVFERIWARPTLEVHGIRGGHREGAKTVIPARGGQDQHAVVADQRPEEAAQQLRRPSLDLPALASPPSENDSHWGAVVD
jgi:hypothetical protein